MSKKLSALFGVMLVLGVTVAGVFTFKAFWPPSEGVSTSSSSSGATNVMLSGVVVDVQGRPIGGAQVYAAQEGEESMQTTSTPQGIFAFDALPPGEWTLRAKAKGFVALGPESMSATVTKTSAGQELEDVSLVLARPVRVRGRVTNGATPIQGASLGLFYQSVQGASDMVEPFVMDEIGTTDANGAFDMEGPPGSFRVTVNASGYPFTQAPLISLDAATQRDNVRIDLSGGAQVTVSVQNKDGAWIASDVTLKARGLDVINAKTSTSSPLVLEGVPIGRYLVDVSAPGYASVRMERTIQGARASINVQLKEARGVFGRVTYPRADASMMRAAVEFLDDDMNYAGRMRVTKGRFNSAKPPSAARFIRAVSPYFGASTPLAITQDQEMVLALSPGGKIHGRVERSNGQGVASYRIRVDSVVPVTRSMFSGYSITPQVIQSAQGGFSFDALSPGTYTLLATPTVPGLAAVRSNPIRVGPSSVTGPVVLTATAGATITGVVRAQGKPIEGARVQLVAQRRRGDARAAGATTDAQGRYKLKTVGAGIQSIMVSKKGYMTQEASGLRVPQEGTLSKDVDLEKAQPGARFAFHGIGATLKRTDDGVVIQQVMDGMPASTFGLQAKDLITSVDGEDVLDMPLQDVIKLIRGEQGVRVAIEVERPGEGMVNVEVERGRVVVKNQRRRRRRRGSVGGTGGTGGAPAP